MKKKKKYREMVMNKFNLLYNNFLQFQQLLNEKKSKQEFIKGLLPEIENRLILIKNRLAEGGSDETI
ncbi:MAG: hypothetical protein AB1349_10365 [Elusimicrobiota bacterium]